MNQMVLLSSLATLALIAGSIAVGLRRGDDLICFRTIFLLGFAFFFPIASIFVVPHSTAGEGAKLTLAIAQPMFVVLFLASSYVGGKFGWVERYIPTLPIVPSFVSLLTLACVMLALGSIAALITRGGFGAAYLAEVKTGLSTVAVGLATYLLIVRRFNPVSIALFAGTLAIALVVSTVGGSGRRGMLNVLLAVPWMWYFASLRYQPFTRRAGKLAVAALAGAVLIVGYSGVRHQLEGRATFQNRAAQLQQIARGEGVSRQVATRQVQQDTPLNTMFIIENYGGIYPHQPLAGLHYYLVNPIPRVFYPDKPIGLGIMIQEQTGAVANLAPGIIGHGWYEAGMIGIAYYAIAFGFVMALLDGIIKRRIWSPFFLAVMAASLGNVFGLPRGETPLFAAQITAETVGAFGIIFGIGLALKGLFDALPPLYPRLWQAVWAAQDEAENLEHDPDALREGVEPAA